MKKKGTMSWWKGKAWEQFSKYIRIRDALRTTGTVEKAVCCSCGRIYPAFGVGCLQAGHLVPGRNNGVLFCELGCHGQCYNCNLRLKGNWPPYHAFMVEHYGIVSIDRLLELRNEIVKFLPFQLEQLRDTYKWMHRKMLQTKQLLKGETYEDYASIITTFDSIGSRVLRLSGRTEECCDNR